MFERFTPDARAIVVDAQHHARRLEHGYIGCEHLLLALTASPSPVAAQFAGEGATPEAVERVIVQQIGAPDRGGDKAALASLGIDLDEVRKAVEANFGSGALDPATGRQAPPPPSASATSAQVLRPAVRAHTAHP